MAMERIKGYLSMQRGLGIVRSQYAGTGLSIMILVDGVWEWGVGNIHALKKHTEESSNSKHGSYKRANPNKCDHIFLREYAAVKEKNGDFC